MCPHLSAKNADVGILSASDPHPIRIPLLGTSVYTRYPSTNDRSMMSTGGRSVCSHSNGRTGSGRSMGSYSCGSPATAPLAVTSPRGRGSPVSTGGRSVCSHSSGHTGSGRSTGSYSRGSPATAPFAVTQRGGRGRSSPQGRGSPRATPEATTSQRGGRGRSSPQGRGSPRATPEATTSQRGGRGRSSPQGRGHGPPRPPATATATAAAAAPSASTAAAAAQSASTAAAAPSASGDDSSFSYARVMAMKYKDLQKECKNRKLKATGTTEQLRNRLMGKEGMFIFLNQTELLTNTLTFCIQILKTQALTNPAINNRFLGRTVRQKCT